MAKGKAAAAFLIFKVAFIMGFLFNVGQTYDVPTNQADASMLLVNTFCDLDLLEDDVSQRNCDNMKYSILGLSVIMFLVSIFAPIKLFGHVAPGLVIFAVSWAGGYLASDYFLI